MRLSGVTIKVDAKAVGRLLKSDEVRDALMARAERGAEAAGEGFVAKPFYGFDRVSAIVKPDSSEALTALYEDSTVLTRALGAMGDG